MTLWRKPDGEHRTRRPSTAMTCGIVCLIPIVLITVVGVFWTPKALDAFNIADAFARPGQDGYILGADGNGRDVLTQLMIGARGTLAVAAAATVIALALAVAIGGVSAIRGGWVDNLLMHTAGVLYAFPSVVMAIVISARVGKGNAVTLAAIVFFFVPTTARLVRGVSIEALTRGWFVAARTYGRSRTWIYTRQVLPNLSLLLTAQASLMFASAILVEASLQFIGLGPQPPAVTWGGMLATAQQYATTDPLLALWPGLTILLTVLGVNLIGDGFQQRLGR